MQPSSAAVGVALRGRKASLDPKTTELMVTFLKHRSEHYGQWMTLQESVSGNLIFTGRESGNIVSGVFTPVLAKHSKSFSLIDCVSVGVDRMQFFDQRTVMRKLASFYV